MIKVAFSLFLNIFTVIWALFGWLYFYEQMKIQAYSPNPYADVNWQYYIWDKLLAALLCLCAAFPFKQMRAIFIITSTFYIFRFFCDLFKELYNPELMFWLWIIDITAIGVTIMLMIIGIYKEFDKADDETDNVRIG